MGGATQVVLGGWGYTGGGGYFHTPRVELRLISAGTDCSVSVESPHWEVVDYSVSPGVYVMCTCVCVCVVFVKV